MSILSNINHIKFGMLSPYDIEKISVVEVSNPDTFEAGKPKKDGLYDTRMGVIDASDICPTDNTHSEDNIGYFGHIKLGKPVFNINCLDTIRTILTCVSFKGSKLLVNKNDPVVKEQLKAILKKPRNIRLKQISKLVKSEDPYTGAPQPSIIKDNNRLFYEYKDDDASADRRKKLTPEMVHYIFKNISNEDCELLGFSPKYSRPEWMIIENLPVPPPQARPASKVENMSQRSEDDSTHRLIDIIKFNQLLKKRQSEKSVEKIEPNVDILQYYVATLFNNQIPKIATSVHRMTNRPLKGYKQKFEKKDGRVRGNLEGKRVNFCARTVITADPNISVEELGVPIQIAMNLTKQVYVTPYNIDDMYKYIYNGPEKHPGAKSITFGKTGQTKNIKYLNVADIKLEPGDIIERHMIDGDFVLFNRQPTLHLESMMVHRAKIMNGSTFRLSISATKPYNADFDGDN
jgi:DNA-directed RNA polymerase II subunit RPB1